MQWQPDWGLRGRMVVTMFLLFALYIVFVGVLASAGVGLVGIVVVMGIFSFAQLFFSDKLALYSMGARTVEPEEYPELHRTVDRLGNDPDVTALFVQAPLPAHVDEATVRRRVPVEKDVDCFAPANVGRLVAGDPRVRPVTEQAVDGLLSAHDVPVAGRDAVVVGRTTAVGLPLAHLLCRRDATVTVCHTSTADLGAKTRSADLLVTAAGTPGLVDGSMVTPGVDVVDVSANRADGSVVGDVDAESVREKAAALTPVPGGVGPLTMAYLLRNVVSVSARA